MITEDYVSFETSKFLKEKGFKGDIYSAMYDKNGILVPFSFKRITNSEKRRFVCDAPTLQMAMKWLREVHHYYIQIMLDSWACGGHLGYYVVIQKTDSDFNIILQDFVEVVFYQTYEGACEAAIKYCLENLI